MRQFGMQQPIPGPVMQPNNIHDLTLKGKEGRNWMRLMQPALNEWNSRYERRVEQTPPQTGTLSLNSEYMRWYRRKTKVYVDPKHARRGLLVYIVHYNLEKNVALIEDYFNNYSFIFYAG